jgi:hypothetical protein
MPAYNETRHTPPAAEALVVIEDSTTGRQCPDVPMLIDSGADLTILPGWVISRLGTTTGRAYALEGFDGHRSSAVAVQVTLRLEGRTIRGQFLSDRRDYGILGRDILNFFHLHLDGPNLSWHF